MATGADKLKRQQLDRAAAGAADLPTGEVVSVSPFTVSFRGSTLAAPDVRRLAVYSPAAGDVTLLVRSGGVWVALGPSV